MENKENDIIKKVYQEINVAKKQIYSKALKEIIKDFDKGQDCPADFTSIVEFIRKRLECNTHYALQKKG